MSITDFLNARIAEDEIRAQQASPHSYGDTFANDNYGWLLIQPARVLAECAAKRAIVELHQDAGESQGYAENADYGYIPNCCGTCGTFGEYGEPFPCDTFRTLAAVYADHEDYRDEWRVGA